MPVKRVRLLTVAAFSLLTVMIYGTPAFAACGGSLTVTQVTALDFATWSTTTTAGRTAIVTTGGATTGSTGTLIYGTVAAGNYTITDGTHGNCTNTMSINVSAMGSCGTNCSMGGVTALWAGVSHTTFPFSVTPGSGTLNIGATATHGGAGMPTGSYNPAYTITVTVGSAGNDVTTGPVAETAGIDFDTPLSFGAVTNINFGDVKAGVSDDYTIDTAGAVSHTGAGGFSGGTPVVGSVSIAGSTAQAITISITGTTASSGVSITAERGKYGLAAETNFPISGAAPAGGTTLLFGATVHADGTQTDGLTANPSMTVQVVYQ